MSALLLLYLIAGDLKDTLFLSLVLQHFNIQLIQKIQGLRLIKTAFVTIIFNIFSSLNIWLLYLRKCIRYMIYILFFSYRLHLGIYHHIAKERTNWAFIHFRGIIIIILSILWNISEFLRIYSKKVSIICFIDMLIFILLGKRLTCEFYMTELFFYVFENILSYSVLFILCSCWMCEVCLMIFVTGVLHCLWASSIIMTCLTHQLF